MKVSLLRAFLSTLLFLSSIARADDAKPNFPAPPRLATTPTELAQIKAAPDFSAVREATVKAADALLANPVTIPDGYGGWYFNYACPDDGAGLKMISPTEHECTQCHKIYSDEVIVSAYRYLQHAAADDACEKLGWAYAYSGDERYVAEVKRILLKLAHDYPSYPARRDRWGFTGKLARLGGRRFVQSLDEAVGVIPLAKGYDLTRNSPAWSEAEKNIVETEFFDPTAATLLEFNQDINNHQTWYNAGLLAIASVRGDADLVKRVLTMTGGVHDQLARSVGRDGLWYEGTIAYHSYALRAWLSIMETGRRIGLSLQDEPKFRAMLLGPLHAAYPNGQFPAINDSDLMSIGLMNEYFDWGWKTYHEPIFAQARSIGDPARLKEMLGADATPQSPLSTQSEILPDAGLAILRQGAGKDAVCTFLDYGQHGEGHGHFDKLNLMLYANNREWLLDPGRLSYSYKEYKTWVKETAAHNTVTVGGKSQNATTGKLLFFQNEKNFAACGAISDASYGGVLLRRYLLLTPKFLFDIFEVESQEKTQLDWFGHAVVDSIRPVETRGDGEPSTLGAQSGYQHLLEGKSWKTTRDSRWDFLSDEKNADAPKLRLWLMDNEPEEIFTATGIGYQINQKAPALIRRREAASTRFITAYDLSGRGDWIRKIEHLPEGSYKIETAEGNWKISFSPEKATAVFNHK